MTQEQEIKYEIYVDEFCIFSSCDYEETKKIFYEQILNRFPTNDVEIVEKKIFKRSLFRVKNNFFS